ncbi:MAG: bifunctional glutamate N-acetyltransferase/amino-acid acetyltransferase ArgJ [Dehalococcoidia bacterium]
MSSSFIHLSDGGVTSARGFLAGATSAGIKPSAAERPDLALLCAPTPCAAAAVYTTNRVKAAPLLLTQRHLADGRARAVIVNSGNANCLTGQQGMRDAVEMAKLAANRLEIPATDVIVASTGVTGWPLPMDRIRAALPRIQPTEDGGDSFAHAIMTTDTVAKQVAVRFAYGDVEYTVGGCAKGSGMIHPQMATMLAFLTTDAPVAGAVLVETLREAVDASFNMITVDGDTSTNDMAVILAGGGGDHIEHGHPAAPAFQAAVREVCTALARRLARDGEGATKLIEVRVEGAASVDDARRAARTVAGSPLVKAALHGGDPNWGRVLTAAGRSGAELEETRITLHLQDTCVFQGAPVPFDEPGLGAALSHPEVRIHLDLGVGQGAATAWGCDLSQEYVRINSEYTT